MTIRYTIRPFGPDIKAAYERLFPHSGAEKTARQLSWRFESNPHGPGLFAVAQAAGADDRIVGMIALVATRLNIGDSLVPAYQAIDTVVDPAYRGRGVFVGLGKVAQDAALHGGRILWGFPNANAAPGWFGRLGWTNLGTVPFMVRPLRTGYFLRKLHPALGKIDLSLIRVRRVARAMHHDIERFDHRADDLWQTSRTPAGVAVERSSDWLNWRLIDKPGTAYRNVALRDESDRLEAFVSTCVLDKHGGRICYVMEAMGAPSATLGLARLLRDEVAEAARQGADAALAWCPKFAPNRAAYRRAGFLPLPERLRPVAINFGARRLAGAIAPEVEDVSQWYVSYLDSDTV